MRKTTFGKHHFAALLLASLLIVSACGAGGGTAPAAKSENPPTGVQPAAAGTAKSEPAKTVKLKVGHLKSISDAPIYIAIEKGYFKQQNLDVEDVAFETGADMIAPLTAGQLDVGGGGISAGFYNALGRGFDIQVVADKGRVGSSSDYVVMMARKDLVDSGKLKSFEDLRSKKIAVVSKTGSNAAQLSVALKKGNLTFKDVEVVEMTFPNMGTAFGSGAIDVGFIPEPFVSRFVQSNLAVKWKGVNDVIPEAQTGVLFYSSKFAKESPDAADRFMTAYLKGVRDYNDAFFKQKGFDEIVNILTKYTTVKETALYKQMVPAGIDPSGNINKASLQSDYDWYKSEGLIKTDVDLSKVINTSFLEHAQKELGKY
ncbi:ABC transporter substrate-binding protein [Paenibacillus hamazuiensis]|uniref:ABC transporter substrate-binding protein n=1 Tax=Paenibacillus hamazuiensis TaxID=2936508 RepID=UPI00200F92BA|nr:ABC transporter substrate-binding protein [Paenibacillus hamazuiensis]